MAKRRTVSRKQGGIIVMALAVVLLVCSVLYSFVGSLFGESSSESPIPAASQPATLPPFEPVDATATPVVINNIPPSGTWWEVYFTDPLNVNDPANWQNSIEGRLIERINTAQTSIHIASFEFDLTPVAEALIAAHNRGVEVRWVTDDENGLIADEEPGHGQFAMLQNAGIEVRSDDRSALMHNKFWIFDNQILWTGSTNITANGIFVQDNNTIVIQSPDLAAIYEREFQEMWDGQFGPTSPSQMANQSTAVSGTPVNVIFTSEDKALEQAIIPLVSSATSKVRFLVFSFTDYPLAAAMIDRAQNGVDVAGVLDKTLSGGQGAEMGTLFCAGVPVRQDGNPQFMHNKIIVIDERYIVTGSMNYSTSAEESNDENVIILDNPEIAALYMADFDRIWNLAAPPEPGSITCP